MELIDKIKLGTNLTKEIKWPGTEEVVLIRLLSDNDYLMATKQTESVFGDIKIAVQTLDSYNSEKETQLLFRAILNPETKERLFSNITDFRQVLRLEVKEKLMQEFDIFEQENNPDYEKLSDEEFDKLLLNLKKKSNGTVGNISNIYTLRRLVLYLANQQSN